MANGFFNRVRNILVQGGPDVGDYVSRGGQVPSPFELALFEADAVYRCVTLLASLGASMGCQAISNDTKLPVSAGATGAANYNRLMREGFGYGSSYEYLESVFLDLLLYGGRSERVTYDARNNLRGLERIHPDNFLVSLDNNGNNPVYSYIDDDGKEQGLNNSEVNYVKLPNDNLGDGKGKPPVSRASQSWRLAMQAGRYLDYICGRLPYSDIAVIMDKMKVDDGNRDVFYERFLDFVFPSADARKYKERSVYASVPWLMSNGENIRLQDLFSEGRVNAMENIRTKTDASIAARYGVPLSMINQQVPRDTEDLSRGFFRFTHFPMYLARIESSHNKFVGANARVEFDSKALLRGDWSALASVSQALSGPNSEASFTHNERRAWFGIPPAADSEFGDKYIGAQNAVDPSDSADMKLRKFAMMILENDNETDTQ